MRVADLRKLAIRVLCKCLPNVTAFFDVHPSSPFWLGLCSKTVHLQGLVCSGVEK